MIGTAPRAQLPRGPGENAVSIQGAPSPWFDLRRCGLRPKDLVGSNAPKGGRAARSREGSQIGGQAQSLCTQGVEGGPQDPGAAAPASAGSRRPCREWLRCSGCSRRRTGGSQYQKVLALLPVAGANASTTGAGATGRAPSINCRSKWGPLPRLSLSSSSFTRNSGCFSYSRLACPAKPAGRAQEGTGARAPPNRAQTPLP